MRFFGIYDTASAGSFSSLEQEFVCAGIFSFFSRRLILEKIPIGEWFEDEVWNAVQRFARPQKGASPDPGRPRRIRPRVKSSLFPRIGLVRDSKCLSLARCPSQKKRCLFRQSTAQSLTINAKRSQLLAWVISNSNLLPAANSRQPRTQQTGGTDRSDEVCLWAVGPGVESKA